MQRHERIQIEKDILCWALQESQKDNEKIADKFPKIDDWINGDIAPTFKQLESFAAYLKIPFGYMFLETPPKDDAMEAEFRSINNKLPAMSKNLKDTLAEMDMKRNWMSDYRKDLGWGKLDIITKFDQLKSNAIIKDASLAKELLNLKEDWYKSARDHAEAYSLLKSKMEDAGILVMQNGVVANNNYRKLDISEFRAFMLYDDISPLIFINNNDTIGGKVFSIIHEYIHVLFGQEDLLLNQDILGARENERFINQLTSELLLPAEHLKTMWNKRDEPFRQIQQLGNLFKVSETALAIKLKELTFISNSILEAIIDEATENFIKKANESSTSGGDFYNTFGTRISPTFAKAVIRSTEAGDIGYTYAFRLLGGIRGKTYDEIKERLLPYG